jgi:hypothetical protein
MQILQARALCDLGRLGTPQKPTLLPLNHHQMALSANKTMWYATLHWLRSPAAPWS